VEDAEFYRQLLKEFLETIDPASSGIVKKNILESLDMNPPPQRLLCPTTQV